MPKESKSILHIYITEEEKELLRQKTKESGCVSLNEYARKRLFAENAVTNMSFNGLFDANTVLDASVDRNRIISTTLSDEEYDFVKKMAGPSTMSAFLRRLVLSTNTGKFTFDIKVDDLSEVRNALTDFNLRMGGIIGALRYRGNGKASRRNK